jgi:hypothetical protein
MAKAPHIRRVLLEAINVAIDRSNEAGRATDANWRTYGIPIDRAAALVTMTAATAIAEVLLKIDIIDEFELDGQLPLPALAIIQEDLRRLGGAE